MIGTDAVRLVLFFALAAGPVPAIAGWEFNASPTPAAFTQSGDMSLELQCDRIRFVPMAYEDARDIIENQGLSFRFMPDGASESGAFQAGGGNADIRIVDNYPVEVVFRDPSDYEFILAQVSGNATLNLSMVSQDVSYGLFDLSGSASAIRSLSAACRSGSPSSAHSEPPEGEVYCGGGAIKRQIEFIILDDAGDKWDARVTVNGETIRAMTAYSYFGNNEPPGDFVVALLGEDRSEFLVFRDRDESWIEFGDYSYRPCN